MTSWCYQNGKKTQKIKIIEKTREEISTSRALSKQQKGLLLFYFALALVSVIPTFEYGAGFSQDFALAVAPQLNGSTNALEGIRIPFASASSAVNGVINTRSFYFAMSAIFAEIVKIYYTEKIEFWVYQYFSFFSFLGGIP